MMIVQITERERQVSVKVCGLHWLSTHNIIVVTATASRCKCKYCSKDAENSFTRDMREGVYIRDERS